MVEFKYSLHKSEANLSAINLNKKTKGSKPVFLIALLLLLFTSFGETEA